MKSQQLAMRKQGAKPVALCLFLDDDGIAYSRQPKPAWLEYPETSCPTGDGGIADAVAAWGRLKEALQPAIRRGHAEIVALWSPELSTVERAQAALGSLVPSAQLYFGFSTSEEENDTNGSMHAAPHREGVARTLETLLTTDAERSGILLHLHHSTQQKVLESVFRLLGDTVPLLSWGPPSFDPDTYTRLFALRSSVAEHGKRGGVNKRKTQAPPKKLTLKPGIWFVDEPMRFEPAVSMVLEIIPDLGTVLGAALQMALLPPELTTWSGTLFPEDRMKATCVAACAVLRRLLGDIQSLSCAPAGEPGFSSCFSTQTDMSPPPVSGWIKFINGATSSVTIADAPFAPVFELVITGTLGEARLSWDADKKCFMLQRCLQHYEHPLSQFLSGSAWYFEAWLESVREGCAGSGGAASRLHSKRDQNEAVWGVLHSMVDVAVAHAMRTSSGAVVVFRPVPASEMKQSKQVLVN